MRAAATLAMPLAAPGSDAVAVGAQLGPQRLLLHGLDGGPAHQPRALFGDVSADHGGVGFVMAGGQAGPTTQLRRPGEAGDVADLGDKDRGQGWADTRNGLDRVVAAVGGQARRDDVSQPVDVMVIGVD